MLLVLAVVLLLSAEVNSRVCSSGITHLTSLNGRLSSRDKGESGICMWKVDVPTDLRIIFYFKYYDIEYCGSSSTCSGCTRVELRDGPNDLPWKTFCDSKSEILEPISTNKNTLFVNFILANDDSDSWFTADYGTWPFEEKIDLTANSTSEISSPYFPGKYPRNSYFLWSVVAPSEYRIKIEFSKFEMSSCHNCECDFLIVRDGSSKDSKLLGKYCSHPGSLYTSGNHMWMEFASALTDRQRSDSIGFKATVSREIKLYVIVVPCVFGILLVTVVAAVIAMMLRRRRLSSAGNGAPVQMSLLNEDTQLSDSGPHSEASLPVYRPTTRAIKS